MPPKNNIAVNGDFWILIWSDTMIEVFLELLEEAYNNRKKSDTGFKPKAWVGFRAGVQAVYLGTKYIIVEKVKSKLDYVCFLG